MAEEFETPGMFSKLLLQSEPNSPTFNPFNECKTSEDDNSNSNAGPTPFITQKPTSSSATDEDNTGEATRKPRGRPPGSKNKPKPPLVVLREPEPIMSPYVLELASGSDVVESLRRFSIQKNTGLCILQSTGTVANVILRQPFPHDSGATVNFQGFFGILSLSAIIFPHSSPAVSNSFSITLAGPNGRICGGFVVGRLIAAGTVYVVAASFNNQSYHRLPSEENVRNYNNSVSGVGDVQFPAVSDGGGGGGGIGHKEHMYGYHLPSEMIWAPTARLPPSAPPF